MVRLVVVAMALPLMAVERPADEVRDESESEEVEWDRKDDVVSTVTCVSDDDCDGSRCRLLDTGAVVIFADDVPSAFAARSTARKMKARPACDDDCLEQPRMESISVAPLAVCDPDYEATE